MDIIKIKDIRKEYGKTVALKKINLGVESGSIVSILGSNGAGKSTLIKLLCGLLKPTSGSLSIDGLQYSESPDSIKKKLGYVPEESAMYLDVTVMDYLIFFARIYKIEHKKALAIIKDYAARLELEDAFDKRLSELSKGMRRKVLMIRSLINDPSVLIFDEPASGLDPQTSHTILSFMEELKAKGKTIFFSSHNLGHVEQIAERIIILKDGEIIADMPLEKLLKTRKKRFCIKKKYGSKIVKKSVTLAEVKELLKKSPGSILDLKSKGDSLEDIYLALIKE